MSTKRCPYCAEDIQQAAIKCKHCGSWLDEAHVNYDLGQKRLTRSRTDRMLTGVCGGIGQYFQVDPTLIRVAYACATVFTLGVPGLIGYILLSIIVPEEQAVKPTAETSAG